MADFVKRRLMKKLLSGSQDTTRAATNPIQFKWGDWKQALLETKNAVQDSQLSIVGAGIAYFVTLAFFPFAAAAVAIAAYIITPVDIARAVAVVQHYVPSDIGSLIALQLKTAAGRHAANAIVAVIAILISLFSVSGAILNMIKGLNVSYNLRETRKFIPLRVLSYLMAIGITLIAFIVISLLVMNKGFLISLGIPAVGASVLLFLRWIAILFVVILTFALFYRYAPNHPTRKWQWVSWGSLIATVLWFLGTLLFFTYLQRFGNFSKTYSLFAGIIALMIWNNFSAILLLIGASINAALERQTRAKVST